MSLSATNENSDACVSKLRFAPKGNGLIVHFSHRIRLRMGFCDHLCQSRVNSCVSWVSQ
jgi:hypothetical protein